MAWSGRFPQIGRLTHAWPTLLNLDLVWAFDAADLKACGGRLCPCTATSRRWGK